MSVYTIFAFGTGKNSTMKKRDIISQFSDACNSEKAVIEGPDTLGLKVARNVKTQVEEIFAWLATQDDSAHHLNFAGYSRGGVTCIKIANQLKNHELYLARHEAKLDPAQKKLLTQLRAIQIHIFALDPVAGMGDKGTLSSRRIPKNVKSYVAILHMDEMRRDFKPQDMSRVIVDSPATQITMLPLYGNHSDSLKIKNARMQSGAKLSWYLMHQFLSQHGTTFDDNTIPKIVSSKLEYSRLAENPTAKSLLRLFSNHHQERDHYFASGRSSLSLIDGIPVARRVRSLNKHLHLYVKNPDIFTNQLECELLKVAYPRVFNYLFERAQADLLFPDTSACDKTEVISELDDLRQENYPLFERLQMLGVAIDDQNRVTVGEPQGMYSLEPCKTLQQLYPHLIPTANSLNDDHTRLAILEKEVYQLTLRYEREKSSSYTFTPRAQASKAQSIREQVWNIANESPEPVQVKYERILDLLQHHLIAMVRSDSTSGLLVLVSELLAVHQRRYIVKLTGVLRELTADLLHASLSLLKEVISFVTSLGYLGCAIFSTVGLFLEDFGRRINNMVGELGLNPIKYAIATVAYVIQGFGIWLKNMLGIKPLSNFLTSGIEQVRDSLTSLVRGIEVIPFKKPAPSYTVGFFPAKQPTALPVDTSTCSPSQPASDEQASLPSSVN